MLYSTIAICLISHGSVFGLLACARRGSNPPKGIVLYCSTQAYTLQLAVPQGLREGEDRKSSLKPEGHVQTGVWVYGVCALSQCTHLTFVLISGCSLAVFCYSLLICPLLVLFMQQELWSHQQMRKLITRSKK
jgi:hypothetical protein